MNRVVSADERAGDRIELRDNRRRGWDYDNISPYFKMSEDAPAPKTSSNRLAIRRLGGYLTVEYFKDCASIVDYFTEKKIL